MSLSTVYSVALFALVPWLGLYAVLMVQRSGNTDSKLTRAYRWICPVVFATILVRMLTAPNWAAGGWEAMWFMSWWFGHRRICRHDHTKRLRDAATGLVQRVGSRLRVAPVGVR